MVGPVGNEPKKGITSARAEDVKSVKQPPQQAAETPAPPPEVPVPTAKSTPPSVDAKLFGKDDRDCRKALDRVTELLNDRTRPLDDLQRQLNSVAVGLRSPALEPVKDAVLALSRACTGGAVEKDLLVSVIATIVPVTTDGFAGAQLRNAARALESTLAIAAPQKSTPSVVEALGRAHDRVIDAYASLAHNLSIVATDSPQALHEELHKALRESPDVAVSMMLHFGADDIAEAQEWLRALRTEFAATAADIHSEVKTRYHDALSACGGAKKARAADLAPASDEERLKRLVQLVEHNPGIAQQTFAELGLEQVTSLPLRGAPPPGLSDLGERYWRVATSTDYFAEAAEVGQGLAVLGGLAWALGRLPGIVGASVSAGMSARDIYQAYTRANAARIHASAGLGTRETAERLDDAIQWAWACAGIGVALSAFGLGLASKSVQNAVRTAAAEGSGMAGAVGRAMQEAIRMAGAHPGKVAGVLGGVVGGGTGAMSADAREALVREDWDGFGQIVMRSIFTGAVVGGGMQKLAGFFGSKGVPVSGEKIEAMLAAKTPVTAHTQAGEMPIVKVQGKTVQTDKGDVLKVKTPGSKPAPPPQPQLDKVSIDAANKPYRIKQPGPPPGTGLPDEPSGGGVGLRKTKKP